MPNYSIILPVRNGGAYLKECVKSILAQTYTDFNLIVLDNCSTDGSREWVEELADNRVTLHIADAPLSIEESWARVTIIQKNEFITIIGHDDILYPHFLQTIHELITSNPTASLYLTNFNLINAAGKVIRPCKPMQPSYTGADLLKAMLTNTIDIVGTGYVMRAKDYDRLGGIPVRYPSLLFADFELWLNLANISFEAVSPSSNFAFRIHHSTTNASQDIRLHKAMDVFIDYLCSVARVNEKMKNIIKEHGTAFLLFHCRGFSHRLLRTNIHDRDDVTVAAIIAKTKQWATKLGLENKYQPEQLFSIKAAMIIDRSSALRKAFLLFKKLYPKALLGN